MRLLLPGVAAAAATLTVLAPAASAAPKADLVVTSVKPLAGAATPGGPFRVAVTVRDRGAAKRAVGPATPSAMVTTPAVRAARARSAVTVAPAVRARSEPRAGCAIIGR